MQGSGAGVHQWRVNPQAVERCVADVVKIAKELNSDESRYFRAVSVMCTDAKWEGGWERDGREGGREGREEVRGGEGRTEAGKKGGRYGGREWEIQEGGSLTLTPCSLSHSLWIELTCALWWAGQERLSHHC